MMKETNEVKVTARDKDCKLSWSGRVLQLPVPDCRYYTACLYTVPVRRKFKGFCRYCDTMHVIVVLDFIYSLAVFVRQDVSEVVLLPP